MNKLVDWEIKFNNFIDINKNKSFKWGSWDCCKFSNSLIKEITGQDLIPKSLKWKDENTAMVAIKKYGKTLNGSIAKAAKSKKLEKIAEPYIQKADLVVFKEDSELVGICDGFNILGPTDDGIRVKSLEEVKILSIWRVN